MALQHPNERVETQTTETRHGDLPAILRELADRCAALAAAGQQIMTLEISPTYTGRSALAAYRIRLTTRHGRQQAPAGMPHPCPDCQGRGFVRDCADDRCAACDGRGWLAQPAAPRHEAA